MNREGLGISSDLSREMRAVRGLVVSCEEKFFAHGNPKLWIELWSAVQAQAPRLAASMGTPPQRDTAFV